MCHGQNPQICAILGNTLKRDTFIPSQLLYQVSHAAFEGGVEAHQWTRHDHNGPVDGDQVIQVS